MNTEVIDTEKIDPLRLVKAVAAVDNDALTGSISDEHDMFDTLEFIKQELKMGIMSLNEARDLFGLVPLENIGMKYSLPGIEES